MAYGDKRDYPKIDIFWYGKYTVTTTWAKTCKEAKQKYIEKMGGIAPHTVKAHFSKGK